MSKAKGIGEYISRRVVTVEPSANLQQVIEKLAFHNIGAVVVMKSQRPVGILSERDILKRVSAKKVDPSKEVVEPFMTPKLVTIGSNDDVKDVAVKMVRGNFRHLPVVEDGELIGILSIKDVLRAVLSIGDVDYLTGGAD